MLTMNSANKDLVDNFKVKGISAVWREATHLPLTGSSDSQFRLRNYWTFRGQ